MMATRTFRHRCPATDKSGLEICKQAQEWPVSGRQAAACGTCDFVPGVPWQREMAGKMGVLVEDEEPEESEESEKPEEPAAVAATPEAEGSGGEEASPSDEADPASGARF